MHPDPLTPRSLAALMRTEVQSAYNYIARLKAHKVIRPIVNCSFRNPQYELIPGTAGPPEDRRGRRNPKASRPISQFTDRAVSRRVHLMR